MNSIISPFARLHSLTLPRRDWLAGLFAFGAFTLISAGMAVAQTTGSAATAVTAGSAQFGDLPDNAVSVSNGWRCRDGLALGDSGNCELIRLPLNAIVTGNEWVYMPGFSQDGETCKRLMRLPTDMSRATRSKAPMALPCKRTRPVRG